MSKLPKTTPRALRQSYVSERVIAVVGLSISLGLAVLVPVLAGTQDRKTNVLLGAVIFLVGYLLTMDLAIRARLRELARRVLDRLDEVDERRFGSLPLQRLLSVPEIEDAVCDIVSAAADAREKHVEFVADRTFERIERDRDATKRCAEGHFQCPDRQEEFHLIKLALEACTSVKAIAAFGLQHWREPEFTEYFDIYLDFADTVEQTRMFLVSLGEMTDSTMMEILRLHASSGVDTYALDRDKLEDRLCTPAVLFDDSLLLSYPSTPSGGEVDVHFTDDNKSLLDAQENFNALELITRRPRGQIILWHGKGESQDIEPAGP